MSVSNACPPSKKTEILVPRSLKLEEFVLLSKNNFTLNFLTKSCVILDISQLVVNFKTYCVSSLVENDSRGNYKHRMCKPFMSVFYETILMCYLN